MKAKTIGAFALAAGLLLPLNALANSAAADGVVKKIDLAAEKMTIRHGPIKQFDMEDPMTMVYRVTDPAMLKAVKVGDKVHFETDRVNGRFTITRIEKAK